MRDFWINGQLNDQLNVTDRGLMFGDGFFTTMAVHDGKIENRKYHQQRVENSLSQLGIDFDSSSIWLFIDALAVTLDVGGVKLVITRGSGGQGYQLPGSVCPSWIVTTFDLPEHYELWRNQGIRLGIASTKLGIGCCYSTLKTLNRLEQIAIKREINTDMHDDLVVLDINEHIIEASASNIFWRKGRDIFTPELSMAGIHGVMRERILRFFRDGEFANFMIHQDHYNLSALKLADEIWLTNSLMPIVPVVFFANKKYQDFAFSHRLLKCLGYTAS